MAEPANPTFTLTGIWQAAAGAGLALASHEDVSEFRFELASSKPAETHRGHPLAANTVLDVFLTAPELLWVKGEAGDLVSITRDTAPPA